VGFDVDDFDFGLGHEEEQGYETPEDDVPQDGEACIGCDDIVVDWEDAASWGGLAKGSMVDGKHCWGEPASDIFKVRGGNYLTDKKKENSGQSLCRLLAVDFLKAPPGYDFSEIAKRPGGPLERLHHAHAAIGRTPPFVVIINFIFKNGDEPGTMTFYWVRREDDTEDGAVKLFQYLMDPALNTPEGNKRRGLCVKVIPGLREGPWLVKRVLGVEKPAIIAKKITTNMHRGMSYLEIDIDTTSSSAGNAIIGTVRGPLKSLVIDLAFIFEGKRAEFLPERILGTVRLSRLEMDKMPSVEDLTAKAAM